MTAGRATAGVGSRPRPAGWWTVARYETSELWSSAKGTAVLFGFSVIIAVLGYIASANAGINLLDARESVGVIVQISIGLGTLAALVVSADAISGERERGTLEALLVTPVPRRSLVVGKLAASTTMWVATLITALPFVAVMADGPGVVRDAVLVLLVAGALVAAALTALGLAISAIATSNRVSLALAMTIVLLAAAPSQLPAIKANSALAAVLVQANPVSAALTLANNVLIHQQPWADQVGYLVSPIVAAVVLTAVAVTLSNRLVLGGAR